MGFIETLKGQLQEKVRLREVAIEACDQKKAELEAIRLQQRVKAREYFNMSDLPRFARELAEVVGGMEIRDTSHPSVDLYGEDGSFLHSFLEDEIPNFPVDCVGIKLIWDAKFIEQGYGPYVYGDVNVYQHKLVTLEFHPDGTIKVHGGFMGLTTITFDNWNGNPDIQEKALEKAFNHPKTVTTSEKAV